MSVEGWREVKLRDVCTKIGSGATPTGGANAYKTSGISFIRSQNVLDFSFSLDGLAFIDDAQAEKLKSVTVEEGDVLLNITGDSVARSCVVPKNVLPARVNQHVAIVRVDKSEASNKYVFYYTQYIKPLLLSLASNGGTRNALTKAMIEQLDVTLPPLAEQRAIAAILSALDDTIELSNQINTTLEEMAQAIFKSWFVDFEPFKDGEFEESELGLIPEGWKVGTLGEICTDIFSGGTPSTSNVDYWNGNYPWLSSGETRNLIIVETEKSITDEGVKNSSTRLARKNDIVIASAGQGHTRGQTVITLIDTYINQSIVALRAHSNSIGYLFCNLRNRYDELRAISDSSSIRGSLTTKAMKQPKRKPKYCWKMA